VILFFIHFSCCFKSFILIILWLAHCHVFIVSLRFLFFICQPELSMLYMNFALRRPTHTITSLTLHHHLPRSDITTPHATIRLCHRLSPHLKHTGHRREGTSVQHKKQTSAKQQTSDGHPRDFVALIILLSCTKNNIKNTKLYQKINHTSVQFVFNIQDKPAQEINYRQPNKNFLV